MDTDGLEQEHGTKAPALLGETALLQDQDETYGLVQRSYRCAGPHTSFLQVDAAARP